MAVGQGKDPVVWGPLVWVWLHAVAREFDNTTRSAASASVVRRFVSTLGYVLPCGTCRVSYRAMVQTPHRRASLRRAIQGKTLSQWYVRLHDTVNRKLGKKVFFLRRRRGTGRRPTAPPLAAAAVGPAMCAIGDNYTDCGERGKCKRHRDFLHAVSAMHGVVGDDATSRRIGDVAATFRGGVQGRACLIAAVATR
jgi:hypothetical protein